MRFYQQFLEEYIVENNYTIWFLIIDIIIVDAWAVIIKVQSKFIFVWN